MRNYLVRVDKLDRGFHTKTEEKEFDQIQEAINYSNERAKEYTARTALYIRVS